MDSRLEFNCAHTGKLTSPSKPMAHKPEDGCGRAVRAPHDDGHLIHVSNIGIRHAPPDVLRRLNAGEAVDQSQVYFRTVPRFEVEAPGLQWLTRSIFIATGERYPNGVLIRRALTSRPPP